MSDSLTNTQKLLDIMAQLRDPDGGCPWDLKQTHNSIAKYAIEEAYEVYDAIQQGDPETIRDELGDLLLQVIFHAQMASENGQFDFEDVARSVNEKMIARHPHVFGETEAETAGEVLKNWEDIKAEERKNKATRKGAVEEESILDDVPTALPGLTRAQKLKKRAARVGFDWPDISGVIAKVEEELAELNAEINAETINREHLSAEMGDLFFALSNLAASLELDAEETLRAANRKFERRFRAVESQAKAAGIQLKKASFEQKDKLWKDVKEKERRKAS